MLRSHVDFISKELFNVQNLDVISSGLICLCYQTCFDVLGNTK